MIGDSEGRNRQDGDPCEGDPFCPQGMGLHYHDDSGSHGPLDAAVRLNPPVDIQVQLPPAWVERYGRLIVIRHVYDSQRESVTETMHPTEARAVQALARAVGVLYGRGYSRVDGDDLEQQ
jgi:hypothetical protein